MFQVKDFVSICAGMINHMRASQNKITDFNVGSVARTLVEAPAVEMDELYQQMFIGLREAIPVSVYNSFGFDLLPEEASSGVIRFSSTVAATANILIPAGTAVRATAGKYKYAILTDATLLVGQTYIDAIAYSDVAGSETNALINTLTELVSPIPGIATVNNYLAFTSGRGIETEPERKTRFKGYIASLQRGTGPAIKYGVRTAKLKNTLGVVIEDVKFAKIVEPYLTDISLPIGLVDCYVHNGVSGASVGLIAEAQKIIDGYSLLDGTPVPGWKAAGVVVPVKAATNIPVNVTAAVTVNAYSNAADVRAAATVVVSDFLQSIDIGVAVSPSEIIAKLMGVAGVIKVILALPSGDVTALSSQKITPGTITLT